MNEFRPSTYHLLFTRNLTKYLAKINPKSIERFESLMTISEFSARDCEFWVNTNIEFLSAEEALAVGISLVRQNDYLESSQDEKAIKFFEYIFDRESTSELIKEIRYLASLSISIIHFERSVVAAGKENQVKEVMIAKHYLELAEDILPDQELSLLYQSLYMAAIGELGFAVSCISKASKLGEVNVTYFEALESIYEKLEMMNVATFYRNRINKYAA